MFSGSGKANGFNRTVFTTEKIAVLVPMPKASAAIATMVKAGVWRNMRAECFRSLRKPSIGKLDEKYHIQFPESTTLFTGRVKNWRRSLWHANDRYLCGSNIS
jgi:hypothetical protein